ncbi:hypothetical protein G3I59_06365 [Amycolatopsis rubida]|uniref:Uncharacterized protein n=1 Tax=Amycolatopsis rubida TaxID=112413 RepID=A0ABX0BL35_9PSEU|nr:MULTISPECIES: hypothetical protein [Amycolatopsis]MYW90252.1 hypothetical protein [Amycolatopsis rubida]NEC55229.1 hypothetical protein [Amycolatopsis rubida]OAP21789.1 hypothetical protein A4R44_07246 [Amycolatopsis sp. M39]
MDEVPDSALRAAVRERLDYLDLLVEQADDPSKTTLADTVIPQLTGAWRDLLAAHEPDERGFCRICSSRRLLGRARCTVRRAAHLRLLADTGDRFAPGRRRFRCRPARRNLAARQ